MNKFTKVCLLFYYRFLHLWYTILYGSKGVERLIPKLNFPKIYFRILNMKVARNSTIYPGIRLYNFNRENLIIGDNSHIGQECFFDLSSRITIETNVTISMMTTILTHINLGESSLRDNFPETSSQITIESDSYIGAKSLILEQVGTVKSRTFLAAGSVLLSSTKGNSLYAGVPAKFKEDF